MVPRESCWCACFHALPEDWLINRPRSVRVRSGESSIKQLSFRVPSVPSPPCSFEHGATYLGSCPLLTSLHCSHVRGVHRFAGVCPRRSQPFGNFRNVACELVSSRSQVQDFFSFRGLSTSCSLQSSSDWFHPCRSTSARSPASRLPRTNISTPTFCSTRSRSPSVWCLAAPLVAPLFEFSAPPGSSDASEDSYLPASAHVVSSPPRPIPPKGDTLTLRSATSARFQRKTWILCCQSFRPARAFRTFLPLTCQRAETQRPTAHDFQLSGSRTEPRNPKTPWLRPETSKFQAYPPSTHPPRRSPYGFRRTIRLRAKPIEPRAG